ncbi:MAG: winged helix-turn-helix transcriptional regulator [Pseudomonadota bacterium]
MLSAADMRKLGERRWAVPVLAALAAEGGGARYIVMLNRLGCARSALSSALDQLTTNGWVARNPGHGHPLRPEYILTDKGATVALHAQNISNASANLGLGPATFQRWTLPLAFELRSSPRRFAQLKSELIPATPRALSLTLKQMMTNELVVRDIVEDFPPVPLYGLTERGRELAGAIQGAA